MVFLILLSVIKPIGSLTLQEKTLTTFKNRKICEIRQVPGNSLKQTQRHSGYFKHMVKSCRREQVGTTVINTANNLLSSVSHITQLNLSQEE